MDSAMFRGAIAPLLALLFSTGGAATAQPGPVVFSEVMWSGTDASSADEWIELYNRAEVPVDLSGWTVTRGDGADEQVMVVIGSSVLQPGGVFLIANYGQEDDRSRLAAAPHLVDAAISLPNTRLRLRLYDGAPETGSVVDEADDGSGAPFGGTGGDTPASMVRVAFDMPGSQAEAWGTADVADGWDAGASALGTPGTVPDAPERVSDPTNVAATSWGRIKTRTPGSGRR